MDIKRNLARNIRHLRELKNFSQARLAEELDLSLNAVGRIERELLSPSLTTVQNICDVFGVSGAELFASTVPHLDNNRGKSQRVNDIEDINNRIVHMSDKEIRQALNVIQALK